MAAMRHYPHLRVGVLPDYQRAMLVAIVYGLISTPLWLFPMPLPARIILGAIILVPGIVRIMHALQLTGPWAVRELVLTGGGRWILVDPMFRREPAKLVHVGEASAQRIELQFRDRHRRNRTVVLDPNSSTDEQRQRLASRLVYGYRSPSGWTAEPA